ncbi:MAG: hypothetical protein KA795_01815 [Burkholderiaceae bacterium]|nr:hypothetical protein [Burkholderiaceae bacterium]
MGYSDDYERNQRQQRDRQHYGDDSRDHRQQSSFTPFGVQQGDFSSQDRDSGGWQRGQEHENHGRSKFTPSGNQQDFGGGRDRGYDEQRYGSGQSRGYGGGSGGEYGRSQRRGDDFAYANDRESYGGTGRSEYSNDIGRDPGRGYDREQGRDHGSGYGRSYGGSGQLGRVSGFDRSNESRGGAYGREQQPHRDPDYHQWREEQIRNLDNDYDTWRQERYSKFSEEFSTWRKNRQGLGPRDTQEMQSDADVAAANKQIQADQGKTRK